MPSRSAIKKIGIIIAILIVVGVLGEVLSFHPDSQPQAPKNPSSPYFDYTVMIVLENKNLNQVYGASCSGNCSYITQLADSYGLAKNYSGVAHGSLPKYLALTSGASYSYSPWTYNCNGYVQTKGCSISAPNVIDAIE